MSTDSGSALGRFLGRFAVISDSHVNPSETQCNSPFPVNRLANRRLRHAVRVLNQLEPEFVIHLGDLVHPVPESGQAYREAASAYRALVGELRMPIYELPGNHDIGDTPIAGAPASPSTDAMIAKWLDSFGPQYQSFSAFGRRMILINAQLINSGLSDEAVQRQWLENELQQASEQGQPVILYLHHPPYLQSADERPHYDNTNQPGRDWLLALLDSYRVEAVFAGHAHNYWYDRYRQTDYYLAPALSFVRQDYSEMLRAPPPEASEAGRNDSAKLGFFMVHVYESGHVVRPVRSFGCEAGVDDAVDACPLIVPDPREPGRAVLGFDLRQNWAELTEVPPSGALDEFDRKTVRNDYPLLALQEMGVAHLRIPFADLHDPVRRQRLPILKHLGFRLTIFSFASLDQSDIAVLRELAPLLSDWELTIDWTALDGAVQTLLALARELALPVYLSRMRTKADLQAGDTYFHVINHGFSIADADMLGRLAQNQIQGAVFRLGYQEPVAQTLEEIDRLVAEKAIRASVQLRLGADNPAVTVDDSETTARRLQQAMSSAKSLAHTRLVCDTLISVDRGYFRRQGVIDRCCNPTPLFDVVKKMHAGDPSS